MARLTKRILQSAPAVRLAADVIALYIRFVHATSRWTMRGAEHPAAYWDNKRTFVLAFWHGRLLMMPMAWRRTAPMRMLISQHRDGELIARAMDPFHIGTVRGSAAKDGKDKGGRAALRAMLKYLKDGEHVGFTPDGPRGPRMRASPGIIAAARLARVPIIPLAYAVTRRRVISSWDRFILPWPFNRGIFIWGAPIDVHSDESETLDQAALRVETVMNALCAEADTFCGHAPIEPAPAAAAEPESRG